MGAVPGDDLRAPADAPSGPGVPTYAFPNRFVNALVTLPGGARVRTAGRCGGMVSSELDHAAAGVDVPYWPPALFAPDAVPPDGHLVADHLRARQLDSFRSLSALRFITWSALPDRDLGPVAGVRSRTRRELPGVLRALAQGGPVVLGMVVARSPLRAGDNHQVVATHATRDGDAVVLHLLDPNTPGRDVTLVETPQGWRASNGRLWRGFFRHAHTPRTPPPLPGASRHPARPVRAGTPLVLVHVATGRRLVVTRGVPEVAAAGTTTWVPDDGAAGPLADGAHVRLVLAPDTRAGGDGAPAYLTLDGRSPALTGDAATWRVVVDGSGPWREGSRVRLLHVASGALLTAAPLGGTFDPDPSTWWTVGSR